MDKCVRCLKSLSILKVVEDESFLLGNDEYTEIPAEDECGICLELLKASLCIKTENCNHIFHKYCYKKYLEQTIIKKELCCPLCNSKQEKLNIYVSETGE